MPKRLASLGFLVLAAASSQAQSFTTYYLHWSPISSQIIADQMEQQQYGYTTVAQTLPVATYGQIYGTIQIDVSQAQQTTEPTFPNWIGDISLSFTRANGTQLSLTKNDFERFLFEYATLPTVGSVIDAPGFFDFNLVSSTTDLNGSWYGVMTDASNGYTYHLDYMSTTPVPETSTYGLALGGLALVAAAVRRRSKISK